MAAALSLQNLAALAAAGSRTAIVLFNVLEKVRVIITTRMYTIRDIAIDTIAAEPLIKDSLIKRNPLNPPSSSRAIFSSHE